MYISRISVELTVTPILTPPMTAYASQQLKPYESLKYMPTYDMETSTCDLL